MKEALLFVLALILFISKSDAQWQAIPELGNLRSTSICSHGSNIFVSSDTAVYVSTNSGQSWAQTASAFAGTIVNEVYFYPQDNSLYAATEDGLYVSTNYGAEWKKLISDYCHGVCRYKSSIYIYEFGGFISYSSDKGSNWELNENFIFVRSIELFDDTLYIASSGGRLSKMKVNQDSYTLVSEGYDGVLQTDGESLYYISQSSRCMKLSRDTYEWKAITAPKGSYVIKGILKYGGYYIYSDYSEGIQVSDGAKFVSANSGLNSKLNLGLCMAGDNVFTCTRDGVYYANINDLTSLTATELEVPRPGSSFYPNPTNDVLNIQAEVGARCRVLVTDLLGNAVRSSEFESCPAELQISLSGLADGSYCVTVYSNGKKVKSELVIKY